MAEHSNSEVEVEVLPRCELCTEPAHYDAATKIGPWAYLCEEHYSVHGVGLGTGKGQRLVVRA
jgi:hypothetical protein